MSWGGAQECVYTAGDCDSTDRGSLPVSHTALDLGYTNRCTKVINFHSLKFAAILLQYCWNCTELFLNLHVCVFVILAWEAGQHRTVIWLVISTRRFSSTTHRAAKFPHSTVHFLFQWKPTISYCRWLINPNSFAINRSNYWLHSFA